MFSVYDALCELTNMWLANQISTTEWHVARDILLYNANKG
jgi:hypothetical protein